MILKKVKLVSIDSLKIFEKALLNDLNKEDIEVILVLHSFNNIKTLKYELEQFIDNSNNTIIYEINLSLLNKKISDILFTDFLPDIIAFPAFLKFKSLELSEIFYGKFS